MRRADKAAQVAANTFFSIQDGAALFVQANGLMSAVRTSAQGSFGCRTHRGNIGGEFGQDRDGQGLPIRLHFVP